MNRSLPFFLLVFFLPLLGIAQMKGGFKTGLNFSAIKGPLIPGESYENLTGFHIGPVLQFPITDSYGLKAEILYNQAGGKYHFKGDGFTIHTAEDGTKILAVGDKQVDLAFTNTYLDVPLLAYGRIGSFLFEGGIRMGLLIQSNANGRLIFSGATENGSPIEEYKQELLFNYLRDKIGEASAEEVKDVVLDGKATKIPERIGAYFYEDEKEKLFKSFDMGMIVGMSYFITHSLYVGGRVNFGLSDVTNNKADFDQAKTNGLDLIRNADKDKNFQIQLTLGFSL